MTAPKIEVTNEKPPVETNTTTQQVTNQDDPFAAQRDALRQQVLQEAAAAYNPALQDAERRANAATQRVRELESNSRNEPKKDDPTAFLANPQTNIREIIREELAQTAGPINQFMQQQANATAYTQIKAQLRVQPGFSNIMPQVEAYLDQQYMNLNPLNPGSVAGLAMTILGQISAGFLPALVTTNSDNVQQTTKPLPNPSINPSPPRVPEKQTSTDYGEPTEQQRAVMRLYGFKSMKEYMEFTNNDGKIATLRNIKPEGAA